MWADSTPMTRESIRRALRQLEVNDYERSVRISNYWESIPVKHRRNPYVLLAASYVEAGLAVHPDTFAEIREGFKRLGII